MISIYREHQDSRIQRLPGAANFRDLGGYPGLDGRKVRWGRLYRSGHLADLSRGGQKKLSGLNLYAVVDFRSEPETRRKPDRLPAGQQLVHLPIQDAVEAGLEREIRNRIKNRDFQSFLAEDYILPAYQQYGTGFTPVFRSFFHTLVHASGSPVLWHCAAGKDRAGFAAAVLLRLLGVDQEIIFQDYLLSNRYASRHTREMISIFLAAGAAAYQKLKPLLKVESAWLSASFVALEAEWGGFQAYLENGLELSPADIRTIQHSLLE